MTEQHVSFESRCGSLAVLLLAIVLCVGGPLWAADWNVPSGTLDYKMVSLTHISPQSGKDFLAKLGIGTASWLPETKSLLVTGEAGELRKAVAILAVVDAPQPYDVIQLAPASSAGTLPSNERIAEAVGKIAIGTFANPPLGTDKAKALIDVHDGAVLAIAPSAMLSDIKQAVELGPQALKQQKEASRYVQSGAATVQATDMTASSAKTSASTVGVDPASRITGPAPMQERLRELGLRATETQARQESISPAAPQPAAAAMPEHRPAASEASFGQANGQPVADTSDASLRGVGADAQAGSGSNAGSEPDAIAPRTLQPGGTVPVGPEPTRQASAQPAAKAFETAKPASVQQTASGGGDDYEPPEFPNGEQVINLTLPQQLPVIQLIDLVGKYLNLSYVYDPTEVTGDVTLKLNGNLQGSMKVKDLYGLLESVLQSKDLVMTRYKGNIVRITLKAKAMNLDPQLVSPEKRNVEAGDAIVTRVFTLKHIDTANAQNFLEQMGLAVSVTSVAENGTVIITAYSHRMARIDQLLQVVDTPGEPRKFRFRQLRYTMAQILAEKVKALAEQLENVSVTVGGSSAEPDVAAAVAKLPSETEAAYRARVARIRAAQAQAVAAQRARTQGGAPETKPGVYLDADERTNRILMIGLEEQLKIVEDLVDTLDVQQQDLRALELYRIKHVDADEVAKKLQELGVISKLPESSTPGRITGTSRTPGIPTLPGQPRGVSASPEPPTTTMEVSEGGIAGEPQVVVVESTNSLLVNATPEQHARIAAIVEYVDSEMLADENPYKIYPLENSSPDHLAKVLESLIQETIEQEKEGKIEKTVVSREEKIKIVPDPNTYSLIVYASKKNQDWLSSLIKQLDKRRPQVLIDVTLVEITQTDKFQYDLNLVKSFPNLNATSGLTGSIGGTTSSAILDNLHSTGSDRFIDTQSNNGNFTAFYGDASINALLTAMKSKDYGRVLAKPKILVNDNEKGNIKTADTTYVRTQSAIPINTGAAGTQQNLIQTSVDFKPYEAGIELNITPHISEGDLLRLDIELTRSDFRETPAAPAGESQPPPNTTTSEVKTGVTVPDGSTIILGGLIRLNQSKNGTKVPILGDIPLVGGLFRSINNADTQSKLYVFVKAEVIRPAQTLAGGMDSLKEISERNRTAFEKHELEWQQYQSWPGVKPKPVAPPKVLDAQ
jgi:general secretion pathway protein D